MRAKGEKIRVLRIVNRFNLGGPTFNAAYLTKFLDDRFETLLVGGMHDESEANSQFILDNLGIKPIVIEEMQRSINLRKDWKAYQRIVKIISEFRPHIVHTHASKAGLIGRLAAYNQKVPIIVHTFHGHVFHSYFGVLQTNFYKLLERRLAAMSSRIIAISNQQKREIGTEHRICSPHKIEVVPLGFDLNRFVNATAQQRQDFRKKYCLAEDDVVISIVGRLVPVKNHPMFIRVAAKMLKAAGSHRLKFMIVGDGESRLQLEQLCKSLAVPYSCPEHNEPSAQIIFTSWIQEVEVVCTGSEIICLTSLNEGTPVSLIEAQAAGKPIVTTKVGGIQDIVLPNESAFLVDANDDMRFEERLWQLVNDGDLRFRMGEAARQHVLDKFSYQRLVNDISNVYTLLAQEKSI